MLPDQLDRDEPGEEAVGTLQRLRRRVNGVPSRRTVGRWTAWLGRHPRWLSALVGAVGLIALGAVAAGAWFLVRK